MMPDFTNIHRREVGTYLRFGMANLRGLRSSACCLVSIEKGAKLVACFQLSKTLLESFSVTVFSILLIHKLVTSGSSKDSPKWDDEASIQEFEETFSSNQVSMMVWIACILCFLYWRSFVNYYLLLAVNRKNTKNMGRWLIIQAATTISLIIHNIIVSIKIHGESRFTAVELIGNIFDIYSLWVISEYKATLKETANPTVQYEGTAVV